MKSLSAQEILKQDEQARSNVLDGSATLAALVDSTILKPGARLEDLVNLLVEASAHKFRSVCVSPIFISELNQRAHTTRLCTVVGFPHGAQLAEVKVRETEFAIRDGADEIDFVHNISTALAGDWRGLESEYRAVVKAAGGKLVKVIFETALLSETQIAESTRVAIQSGVHIVKTSTGFASRGASLGDIEIMKNVIEKNNAHCGIKASGGIRTQEDALAMVRAGATRLGTSQGVALLNNVTTTSKY